MVAPKADSGSAFHTAARLALGRRAYFTRAGKEWKAMMRALRYSGITQKGSAPGIIAIVIRKADTTAATQ